MRSARGHDAAAAASLAAMVLLMASTPSFAHRSRVARSLMIEPSNESELEVLAAIRVPSGAPRRALEVLFDGDRDGRLSPSEEAGLRAMLVERLFDGVRLDAEVATATDAATPSATVARLDLEGLRSSENLEAKLKVPVGAGDPVELMVHGRVRLPARTGRLAVVTDADAELLDLRVLRGARPVIRASRGRVKEGGFSIDLGAGDSVRWSMRPMGPMR